MKRRITTTLIAKLRPQAKPYDIIDETERRLLLRVNRTGVMTYFARYRLQGSLKWTRIKLGDTMTLTPDQARAKAIAIRKMVDDGKDPSNKRTQKRLTLREFVESHYAPTHLAMRKTGTETLDRLNTCFPSFMSAPMEAVSAKKIDEWRARRKADGVAAATINRDVTTLKACLSKAVEWGYIEEHPLAGLRPLRTDSHPTVRYLKPDELERLLDALDAREKVMREERERFNEWRRERGYEEFAAIPLDGFADYLRPMVLLSLNTGLRRGELFALEWPDIDFEARTLAVRGTVAKSGNTRIVGLNNTAFSVLQRWRRQHPGIGLVFKSPKTGKAFDNVSKAWREVLKDAKITGFRWHDMRHSFASWLVQSGVDLYVVRQLMGHSSIAMTERYAHLAPKAVHEAVNRIRTMEGTVVTFPRSRTKKKR